jgi:hypothetical protein
MPLWDAPPVVATSWPARRSPMATVPARILAVAVVSVALAALHLPHRPRTLCLFRAVTGVPCPFCGGTTAVVELGHGDLRAALAASPLAALVAAGLPFVGAVRAPAWWSQPRVRLGALALVLAGAEIWQLVRFGVIGG